MMRRWWSIVGRHPPDDGRVGWRKLDGVLYTTHRNKSVESIPPPERRTAHSHLDEQFKKARSSLGVASGKV